MPSKKSAGSAGQGSSGVKTTETKSFTEIQDKYKMNDGALVDINLLTEKIDFSQNRRDDINHRAVEAMQSISVHGIMTQQHVCR